MSKRERVALAYLDGAAHGVGQGAVNHKSDGIRVHVGERVVDVDDAGLAVAIEVDRIESVSVDRKRLRRRSVSLGLQQGRVIKGLLGHKIEVANVNSAISAQYGPGIDLKLPAAHGRDAARHRQPATVVQGQAE